MDNQAVTDNQVSPKMLTNQ